MVLEAVVGIEHAGDAPLGLAAVGLLDRLLGDHHDRQFRIDRQRRPQARQSAADDQHVGEEMRHVFGMERNEVSRIGRGHVEGRGFGFRGQGLRGGVSSIFSSPGVYACGMKAILVLCQSWIDG